MHVVILAEFASPSGGAEKVAVESARGLAEAGLRVTYVQGVAGPVDPLLDHRNLTRICLDLPDVWARNPVA
ncbi:glycosyl transferase family 1, partial [Methylobacterium sp. WL116]